MKTIENFWIHFNPIASLRLVDTSIKPARPHRLQTALEKRHWISIGFEMYIEYCLHSSLF